MDGIWIMRDEEREMEFLKVDVGGRSDENGVVWSFGV